jgi:hypothetical protein
MPAKYILAAASLAFFVAAAIRGPRSPQGRIWLRIALIFAAVSLWLFVQGWSRV